MTFFIDLLMKTTVLIAVGAVVVVALHRASAAARHVAWTLVVIGCLALPLLVTVVPTWRLAALPDLRPVALTQPVVEADTEAVVDPIPETVVTESAAFAEAAPTRTDPISVSGGEATGPAIPWYVWVWAAGALAVLIVFATGACQLHGIASRADELDDPVWREDAAEIAAKAGLAPGGYRLLRGVDRTSPMTWGVWRPVIVLPRDCADWSEEQRHEVLLHELAHVRRRDCLTQWLANVACIVYWCHPLVWWTARRMLVERERACDDHVIRGGAQPSGYAKHLLEIAQSLGASRSVAPAGVSMARRSQVSGRLLSVLDPACNRGQPRRGHVLTALAFSAAVLLPLAAVQPGRTAYAAPSGMLNEAWDPSVDRSSDGAVRDADTWRLDEIREVIADVNADIMHCIDERDAETAAKHYSDDAILFGVGGEERRGRHDVVDLYESVLDEGYRKLSIESLELRRVGDDMVYERGRFTYTHKDGRTKMNCRYATVWRYEHGRWLVYRDMANI